MFEYIWKGFTWNIYFSTCFGHKQRICIDLYQENIWFSTCLRHKQRLCIDLYQGNQEKKEEGK